MNKTLCIGIYILILPLIISCTTLPTSIENRKKEMVGRNIDDVFNKWGAPSSSTSLPSSKGIVYIWNNSGCKNIVTTNNYGIITNYSASGKCSYIQQE